MATTATGTCAAPSELCFFDARCAAGENDPYGGLGCSAGGHVGCRFCGFGNYLDIPCPSGNTGAKQATLILQGSVESVGAAGSEEREEWQAAFKRQLALLMEIDEIRLQILDVKAASLMVEMLVTPGSDDASLVSVDAALGTLESALDGTNGPPPLIGGMSALSLDVRTAPPAPPFNPEALRFSAADLDVTTSALSSNGDGTGSGSLTMGAMGFGLMLVLLASCLLRRHLSRHRRLAAAAAARKAVPNVPSKQMQSEDNPSTAQARKTGPRESWFSLAAPADENKSDSRRPSHLMTDDEDVMTLARKHDVNELKTFRKMGTEKKLVAGGTSPHAHVSGGLRPKDGASRPTTRVRQNVNRGEGTTELRRGTLEKPPSFRMMRTAPTTERRKSTVSDTVERVSDLLARRKRATPILPGSGGLPTAHSMPKPRDSVVERFKNSAVHDEGFDVEEKARETLATLGQVLDSAEGALGNASERQTIQHRDSTVYLPIAFKGAQSGSLHSEPMSPPDDANERQSTQHRDSTVYLPLGVDLPPPEPSPKSQPERQAVLHRESTVYLPMAMGSSLVTEVTEPTPELMDSTPRSPPERRKSTWEEMGENKQQLLTPELAATPAEEPPTVSAAVASPVATSSVLSRWPPTSTDATTGDESRRDDESANESRSSVVHRDSTVYLPMAFERAVLGMSDSAPPTLREEKPSSQRSSTRRERDAQQRVRI